MTAKAYAFMDATPYGYSFFVSAKACSHAASTGGRTSTGLVCTNDSDSLDRILVAIAWCEEDETAMKGLRTIRQWSNQQNEQSKNLNNRSSERAQKWPRLLSVSATVEDSQSVMVEASRDR